MSKAYDYITKNIDSLTKKEIMTLGEKLRSRYKELQKREADTKKANMSVGDKMKFDSKKEGTVTVTIDKINTKTVLCTDVNSNKRWKVDINLLRRVRRKGEDNG